VKVERRRRLIRAEWGAITSSQPVVAQFINEYGELPPRNYLRRLWWWLSGAGGVLPNEQM
jgi:hypothetical protein